MAGLPGELNREIQSALLATRLFDAQDLIRSLFVDERLFRWQYHVPGGHNPAGHVAALVDFLYAKNEGEGLLALLQVVQESLPEDSTRREVARVAGRLAAHLQNPQLADEPPFLGLPAYQEQDAHRFFGRERVAEEILEAVQAHPFLCVVGASGSGKSSVVRAGVVPAVRRGALSTNETHSDIWPLEVITPGEAPLKRLAAALTRRLPSVLATKQLQDDMAADAAALDLFLQRECPAGARFFLVVDQFEELYTGEAIAGEERQAFIGNLLRAVGNGGLLTLLLTLRADFYQFVLEEPAFAPLLPERQYNLGPMSAAELHAAMTGPLLETPWRFQPGLVDTILGDLGIVGDEGRPEPGALPLLSHALLETWRRREGVELTLAGYQAVGGIEGAIAQTAEEVYTQTLPVEQRPWAEHIFLQLVALGEGTQDTGRRASWDEMLAGAEKEEARAVLNALADARLVVTEEEGVQVAHEALIRNWPRLRTWLADNRADLRLYRRLAADAQEWSTAEAENGEGEGAEYLYRGGRLEQAQEVAQAHPEWLHHVDEDFLAAAIAAEEAAAAAVEAQQQRELTLERARAAAEQNRADEAARSARRFRVVATVTSLVAFIAVAAVIYGWWQSQLVTARNLHTQAQLSLNDDNAFLATILAAQSDQFAPTIENSELLASLPFRLPAQGRQLSGYNVSLNTMAWSPDGRQAYGLENGTVVVLDSNSSGSAQMLTGHNGAVYSVAWSADGRLASGSLDGNVIVWDLVKGEVAQSLSGDNGAVYSVAWSIDGRLASGSDDGKVNVWDPATGKAVQTLAGHTDAVYSVAWSTDGLLASGSWDNTVIIWNMQSGEAEQTLAGHTDAVYSVAWSTDGRLASGSLDGNVIVWDLVKGEAAQTLSGDNGAVYSVAWSIDGRLASGSDDGKVNVWDPATGKAVQTLAGHTDAVFSVAWLVDGNLVSRSLDNTVIIWYLVSGEAAQTLFGDNGAVLSVAWSANGRLASGSEDGLVSVWNLELGEAAQTLVGHTSWVHSVAWSADNQLASGSQDGTVIVWDLAKGEAAKILDDHTGAVRSVAWSADGRLASGSQDGTVIVWDLELGEPVQTLAGHTDGVYSVNWSLDGRLASGSSDGTVIVWDLASGEKVQTLIGHTDWVLSVAWGANGRLASGSQDGTVVVWDLATEERVQTLAEDNGAINSVAWAADGGLVSGSADGTVLVWDLATGEAAQTLAGHTDAVLSVAWAGDGRLASGSVDNTVIIIPAWAIGPRCEWLLRNLTKDEWVQYVGVGFVYAPVCPELPQPEIVPWRAGWTLSDFKDEGYLYFLITWPGRIILLIAIALLLAGIALVVWLPFKVLWRRRDRSPVVEFDGRES